MTGRAIAARIGIAETSLSKVYNGKKEGGKQILSGLALLLELETLKRRPPEKSLPEQISDLKSQIEGLQAQIAGSGAPYPRHTPASVQMNEDAKGGRESKGEGRGRARKRVSSSKSAEGAVLKLVQGDGGHTVRPKSPPTP